MGNIYFIKCGNFVKIGYAKDVSKRLSELQVGNPYPLTIMTVIPGTLRLEALFHQALQGYRERGEWFNHKYDTPVRKLMVLLNNGARPRTLQDIEILRDFAPKKGFGRGLNQVLPESFNHPSKQGLTSPRMKK